MEYANKAAIKYILSDSQYKYKLYQKYMDLYNQVDWKKIITEGCKKMVRTTTDTKTYTKARLNIIQDHFELFIRCGGMDDEDVDKFLQAVERRELEAVGIYITEDEYRIAEVEFQIDWEKHIELTHVYGDIFDADLPGWKDGVAPEAYVAVSRLAKEAKKQNLSIHSWIKASESIRKVSAK